jgi:hypothetical protein
VGDVTTGCDLSGGAAAAFRAVGRTGRAGAVLVAVIASAVAQSGLAPAPGPDDPAVRTLIPLPPGWRVATERAAGFPAQGLQLYALETPAATPPVRAYCLAWDTTAPTVRFKPVLAPGARTPTQLAAQEPGVVYAAVNGGYFGGTQSFSLVQQNGQVLSPNVKALSRTYQGAATSYFPTRAAFGVAASGRLTVDWIYHVGAGNALVYAYPAPSPNRLNEAPQPVPTAAFPAGGLPWTMSDAIGGSPMLVKDGVVRVTDAEELIEVNNTARRARTALGYTADGIVLLVTVEGDNPPAASGLTLAETAALMRTLGCVGALNLDGGGSTSMVVGGRTTVRPSDGSERPVLSAVLLADPQRADAATAVPQLRHEPGDVRVAAGAPATLQVQAAGGGLAYQWSRDGVPLPGATQPALTFAAVAPGQAGSYRVAVSNARGRTESRAAALTVAAVAPGELVNLSVRAAGGSGEDALIGGFVLRGAGDTMLVRAIGPGLAPLGVTGWLPDPRLELLGPGAAVLAANDDWEAATVGPAAAAAGAFALAPGSPDAALVRAVDAGPHMVAATPARGAGRGNLLIEIYDTGAGGGTLANLSARARVAGGGGELIAGFVVRGDAAATLLVRAVGPALRALGVGDALAAPRLTLVRGDGAVLAENRGWTVAPNALDVREAARRSGAFALAPQSADAALLVTLPPGAYTAVVAPDDGGQGVALIEVYEVR